MTLRLKFILSVVLGIVLSLLIVSFSAYYSTRTNSIAMEGNRLQNVTVEVLDKIDRILESRRNELRLLSSLEIFTSSFEYELYDQANETLNSFLKDNPVYNELHINNTSDTMVACSMPEMTESMGKDEKFIKIPEGGSNLSAPYFDKTVHKYLINISVPFYVDGKQIGVLIGEYDLQSLFKILDKVRITTNGQEKSGHIMVFEKNGLVVYSPKFEREKAHNILKENLLNDGLEAVKKSIAHQEGYLTEVDEHGANTLIGYSFSKGTSQFGAIALHDYDHFLASLNKLLYRLIIFGIIIIILGIFFAVYMGNASANPILKVIKGLTDATTKIGLAANQMAVSSLSLTDGANQQAAGLEEVSASINETASMISQSAENAQVVKSVVTESHDRLNEANRSMRELTATMERISTVSSNTANIVKAIDEISFQTNLLALNAAVEAARAGEAGAGFAVVADEVRSLAMRSKKSAGETSQLIEDILLEIETGSKLVIKTNDAFENVVAGSTKVEKLVEEIATLSSEQAKGIDQINSSVADIEGVSQHNAGIADETSSNSRDLNSQSIRLQEHVASLNAVVKGSKYIEQPKTTSDVEG